MNPRCNFRLARLFRPAGVSNNVWSVLERYIDQTLFLSTEKNNLTLLFSLQRNTIAPKEGARGHRNQTDILAPQFASIPGGARDDICQQGRLGRFPIVSFAYLQVGGTSCAGFPDNGCDRAPPPTFAFRQTHLIRAFSSKKCR